MRIKPQLTLFFILSFFLSLWTNAQNVIIPEKCYLKHASGNILIKGADNRAVLESPDKAEGMMLEFIPDHNGYYNIKTTDGENYLSLNGSWNTFFENDPSSANAKYAIEEVNSTFIRLRCQANNKYLGTDDSGPGAYVYSDKDGTDTRHYWYLTTNPDQDPQIDTLTYLINPASTRQTFEGWGVSLCWWANMCGKWSDEKIDEIVDWLVNPEGLNFRIFRYNIGGGDDPLNRNCTPHHMGNGKGLRAEMEGFKDSSDGEYIWSRDEAQRKIMLKIKEKRPDAIFEAFSNSCPYYMTYSGCCAGNTDAGKDNLRPEYYEEFAHYLVDVCKHYKDTYGIEFRTLEPFNEPMTSYWGANGGQEGCHFDYNSQIAFLKVLSPILKASGLQTVISASDETSTVHSVNGFEAYRSADVLSLVGQWNVHTYSADQASRSQINALCKDAGIPLWMSEVGSGGSGIAGNLGLAQKLMDDIRYIMPSAWIDWQYIEEGNDQWCMVQGNFSEQTYYKVKNYSIRQHFSRFIKEGYTFLTSLNDQTLAAQNATGDTLVIVTINTSSLPSAYQADLSFYDYVGTDLTCIITDDNRDLATYHNFTLENKYLIYQMPAYSITTFIIPVKAPAYTSNGIESGASYFIVPRTAEGLAVQTNNGIVNIGSNQNLPEQIWTITKENEYYTFKNQNGEILSVQSPDYYLGVSQTEANGQQFKIESIDEPFCKIMLPDGSKAFDLEGGNYTAGTRIGLWEYGDSPVASHRQFQLVRVPDEENADQIRQINDDDTHKYPIKLFIADGILHIQQQTSSHGLLTLYAADGKALYRRTLSEYDTYIPLKKGLYILRYQNGKTTFGQTIAIQ